MARRALQSRSPHSQRIESAGGGSSGDISSTISFVRSFTSRNSASFRPMRSSRFDTSVPILITPPPRVRDRGFLAAGVGDERGHRQRGGRMTRTIDEQLTKYLTDAHSIEEQALAQ